MTKPPDTPAPDPPRRSDPPRGGDGGSALAGAAADPHGHWQALVEAGLIGPARPPAAPEVVAVREANDALFRGRRPRTMVWW